MANPARKTTRRLPVRGIYEYFEALKRAETLEAFLAKCDKEGHKLGVRPDLFDLGHKHFRRSMKAKATGPGATTRSVSPGSDCPACPDPPLSK